MYTSIPRAWVPGGRSRAVWAPSPEPLGRLPGGLLGPMSDSQTVAVPLGFHIEIYDDFGLDFVSFWDRSWVPLGVHFRSCWRLCRPKLVPEPSSNRLIFQNVFVHEILRFPILLGVWGTRMATQKCSRSLHDGSLIVLDRLFLLLDFRFFCGSFLVPFLVVLECPNAPLRVTG